MLTFNPVVNYLYVITINIVGIATMIVVVTDNTFYIFFKFSHKNVFTNTSNNKVIKIGNNTSNIINIDVDEC